MENIKLSKCPHCGAEHQFATTFGKITLTSYPKYNDLELKTAIVICLNCSHIELFSSDLVEIFSKR